MRRFTISPTLVGDALAYFAIVHFVRPSKAKDVSDKRAAGLVRRISGSAKHVPSSDLQRLQRVCLRMLLLFPAFAAFSCQKVRGHA